MTVILELKPEIEEALQKKADAKGSPVNAYVEELIQKDVDLGPTLDEILAPVREQFDDSGMTEEELDDFLNGVREKAFREKQFSGKAKLCQEKLRCLFGDEKL